MLVRKERTSETRNVFCDGRIVCVAGRAELFVSTVATFCYSFIRLYGAIAGEGQKQIIFGFSWFASEQYFGQLCSLARIGCTGS